MKSSEMIGRMTEVMRPERKPPDWLTCNSQNAMFLFAAAHVMGHFVACSYMISTKRPVSQTQSTIALWEIQKGNTMRARTFKIDWLGRLAADSTCRPF
jgi:hypothetical protein